MTQYTAPDKREIKNAALREAKKYLKENLAYQSSVEKKALKKVRAAKKKEWKESLRSMSKDERRVQKKAYRYFKGRVYLKRNLVILGIIICLAVIAIIIM